MKYVILIIFKILVPTFVYGIVQPEPYWEFEEHTSDDDFVWTIICWGAIAFISYMTFEESVALIGGLIAFLIVIIFGIPLLGELSNITGYSDFVYGLSKGQKEWAIGGPPILIVLLIHLVIWIRNK